MVIYHILHYSNVITCGNVMVMQLHYGNVTQHNYITIT